MARHWSDHYLMTPYKDLNCAQFVEKVMNEHYKKDFKFPQTEGSFFMESHLIKENLEKYCVKRKMGEFEEGDLVLMSGLRRLSHIGVLVEVACKLYVLHSLKSIGYTSRHRINKLHDLGLILEGVYKWQK